MHGVLLLGGVGTGQGVEPGIGVDGGRDLATGELLLALGQGLAELVLIVAHMAEDLAGAVLELQGHQDF